MAFSKSLILSLVLSLVLVHVIDAHQTMDDGKKVTGIFQAPASAPAAAPIDCGKECGRRCSKTKRPNLCKRACGSCCQKCHCVPPGTFGNLEACPCYANLTIRNNIHKCP